MKAQTHEEATAHSQLTMQVVYHVRQQVASGELKPSDRLPPEREFARKLCEFLFVASSNVPATHLKFSRPSG